MCILDPSFIVKKAVGLVYLIIPIQIITIKIVQKDTETSLIIS